MMARAVIAAALFVAIAVYFLLRWLLRRYADRVADGPADRSDKVHRLPDLNDTRRRTGRMWALMTQHPGLQQRLDTLRAESEPEPAADGTRSPRASAGTVSRS